MMMMMFLAILTLAVHHVTSTKPAPILFIIQAQPGEFHQRSAMRTKDSILGQWDQFVPSHVMTPPKVILTTQLEDNLAYSGWSIFPLVGMINQELESVTDIEWVAILNENTDVDLRKLNEAVGKYEFNSVEDPLFLGRGIKDSGSTIIHHFEPPGLLYPDLESGIFLSKKLITDLWTQLSENPDQFPEGFPQDFNIDPAYEFAKFLSKNGVKLTHIEEICAKRTSATKNCITSTRQDSICLKSSQTKDLLSILSPEVTYIAVKTCAEFHNSRVPVVQNTWGRYVTPQYVSDKEDHTIPTIHLPYSINTVSGHCNKTLAILHHFIQLDPVPEFLVLVDDDTILSVSRLASFLSCYQEETGPILLGQRYGYMVATGKGGYNYITGGGGMILNRLGVERLLELPGGCGCPRPDTPDDMHLGMCARRAKVDLIHSGRMFQARPPDYPSSMLSYRKPISFHKHWEIDPVKVYSEYFEKVDKKLKIVKDEL